MVKTNILQEMRKWSLTHSVIQLHAYCGIMQYITWMKFLLFYCNVVCSMDMHKMSPWLCSWRESASSSLHVKRILHRAVHVNNSVEFKFMVGRKGHQTWNIPHASTAFPRKYASTINNTNFNCKGRGERKISKQNGSGPVLCTALIQ